MMSFFSKKEKKSKKVQSTNHSVTISKNGGEKVITVTATSSVVHKKSSSTHEMTVDSRSTLQTTGTPMPTPTLKPKMPEISTDAKLYAPAPRRSVYTTEPYITRQSIRHTRESHPATPITSPKNFAPRQSLQENEFNNKLKIVVTPSTKFYDSNLHSVVPVYKTRSKCRGKLLIINNMKFINSKDARKGAELDELNMIALFREFGFDVVKHQNLSKTNMEHEIQKFRSSTTLKKADIGCIVVMSHGTGRERSDSTQVLCADGKLIETTWIIDQFNGTNCENLLGKPKIFIFQCCRGNAQELQYDAVPIPLERTLSDMLLAFSTVPGYVSHRDPEKGTLYIQAICKVFMEHAHDHHVEDLLKIVDNKLRELVGIGLRQTSSFENRGFKTCYFHPKLYE